MRRGRPRPEEEPQEIQPYEVMVMIDPEAEESRQDEIIDRIRQTVEKAGGTFESVDAWGRRKLAYEIDHKSEAFYHVVAFTSTPEALVEVTRVLKITDDVVRHMATRRSLRSSGPVEESVPVA
jgi:small subunit ribosomal protein S6